MRKARYGELQCQQCPEAYKLWLTRFDEPEFVQPSQALLWERDERPDPFVMRAMANALRQIQPRYALVLLRRHLYGYTLEEIAAHSDLSRERIRQMERAAIRMVRKRMAAILGDGECLQ